MDPLLLGAFAFVAMIVLFFAIGLHVGTALIIVATGGFIVAKGLGAAIGILQYAPYVIVAEYNFAVFPLFILMGELASQAGILTALFDTFQAWFGRLRGGFGIAVTAMATAIAAVTGSSLASAAMLTRVAFPEMVRHKHDAAAAAGLIASVSPLAVLIPPSNLLVFYGTVTNVSIGKLLIGGLLPGLLSAAVFMVMLYFLAWRSPQKWPKVARSFTSRERVVATKGIAPIAIMMLTVLGGLYGGVFTPSEAGAAGAVIGFIMVIVYRRKKSGRAAWTAVWESAGTTAMIFYLVIGALLFGRFMAVTGASERIVDLITKLAVSPMAIFVMVAVFYLFLGCFLDNFAIVAIIIPIVHPLMTRLGFDPIWLGVVVVVLAEIGMITPPFGMVVFTVKGVIGDQLELWSIFMGSVPFMFAHLLVVALLVIFPQIVLFLPSGMG